MKLLKLEVRNFKPFLDLTLPDDGTTLPEGLIIIRGPNSTGKSSLLEAILWALWGSDSVELNNDDLISFSSTFCSVVLTFEVAGAQFKIDRSYNPADKTNVVLFTKTGKAWKRIADKTQSVATKIDEILGLEWKQAQNTILVRQGEVAAISTAGPVMLRNLLVDIYDIELLNRMSNHLEHFESDLDSKIRALRADYRSPDDIKEQIDHCRKRISDYESSIKNRNEEILSTERTLKGIPDDDKLKIMSRVSSEIERKEHELELTTKEVERNLSQAGILDAEPEIIQARIDSLKREKERVESERDALNATITQVSEEMGKVSGIQSDLKTKIDILTKPGHAKDEVICPTCSKPLSLKERDRLVSEYKQAIREGDLKTKELDKGRKLQIADAKKFEQRLSVITLSTNAAEKVKVTQEQVREIKQTIEKSEQELSSVLQAADIADLNSLLKKFNMPTIADLQSYVSALKGDLRGAKKSTSEIEQNIGKEQALITELEGKEILMKQMGAEIQEMEGLNQHAKYVRRNLVNGFVADYVFQKRLIGIIRSATNQYVRFFTNAQYTSIDLEPTPATKRSGAGLLLKIWDERDQAWKKTSQLSFGDRTAISLALRLGISRTMSSIRPLKDSPITTPRVKTVMLDEPLGGLDKARRESVVSNLINDSNFEQILLITHTDVQGWEGVPIVEVAKAGFSSTATLER
ncbi:MAG: AAA family ATPase [Candidatus Thorarchaeota archaeon]|nr:AAA family ATPase [Candidatus Thorarchaeota archaeon]